MSIMGSEGNEGEQTLGMPAFFTPWLHEDEDGLALDQSWR